MAPTGIAEIGLATGVANALAGIPNHARTWNATYHDVVEFRNRVAEARCDLAACTAEFLEWMEIWNYKSAKWNTYASRFLRSPDDGAPAYEQRTADDHTQAADCQTPTGDHSNSPLDDQKPADDQRLPYDTGLTASHQSPANQRPAEPVATHAQEATSADSKDDTLYMFLWGRQHKQIQEAVDKIIQDMRDISEHIDRIENKKNSPEWKSYFSFHRARYLRNLTYALFSNSFLRDEIARLKAAIVHLKDVSERRLREMQDSRNTAHFNLNGRKAFHLANLEYFGRVILQQMHADLPAASAWSLELCHPDIGGDATDWQDLTSVQLWLSYSMPVVGQEDAGTQARRRIILDYSLDKDPNPPQWASSLPGANPALGDPPRDLVHNPRLIENPHGTGMMTVPVSNLFRKWHGDEFFLAELWAWDQAYLVLSLANWSLLLWTSDWTARWCSSGIHFVRSATDVRNAGRHGVFFPAFSRSALEGPGTAAGQRQHQHSDCCHSPLKLCNLGLVLAEAICITPLRVSTAHKGQYEMCVDGEWELASEAALLDLVDEKTARSKSVRDAVQYCLRSTENFQSTRYKLAGFFGRYVKEVFDP